jgi:5'-nucleotidase
MLENKKPLILVTNDDGINAKGIIELIEGVRSLGEVVVLAPDGARSGMSSAITSTYPIRLKFIKEEKDLRVYSCTGTPVDCVKLAIREVLPREPDLILSGINHGSNSAVCVVYSGTVGAALEGCILGIPSVGISLTDHSPHADFSEAVKFGRIVAEKVLEEGLPKGVCLNLNVPDIPRVKGLKVCSQTKGYWAKEFQKAKDPSGKTVYWLTGEFFNEDAENQSNDEWALSQGYAALVPLKIDMTAHHVMEEIKSWEN